MKDAVYRALNAIECRDGFGEDEIIEAVIDVSVEVLPSVEPGASTDE